jgi:hypothetical protein
MSKKNEDTMIKQFSGVVSIVAFIADLITILLFTKDLLFDLVSFKSILTQLFMIAFIFTFAMLLFNYSREISKGIEGIVKMFGWLYIIQAALIFMIVSFRYMMIEDGSYSELLGYPFLVIAIGGLGYGVTKNVDGEPKYFSIPFMVVALEQIALWVIKVLIRIDIPGTFGNGLLFFIIAGIIIWFFLSVDNW